MPVRKHLIGYTGWADVDQDTKAASASLYKHGCAQVEYDRRGQAVTAVLPKWLCPYFKGGESAMYLPEVLDKLDNHDDVARHVVRDLKTVLSITSCDLKNSTLCRSKPSTCKYDSCPVLGAIYLRNAADVEVDEDKGLLAADHLPEQQDNIRESKEPEEPGQEEEEGQGRLEEHGEPAELKQPAQAGQPDAPYFTDVLDEKEIPLSVIVDMAQTPYERISQVLANFSEISGKLPKYCSFAIFGKDEAEAERLSGYLVDKMVEFGLASRGKIGVFSLPAVFNSPKYGDRDYDVKLLEEWSSYSMIVLNDADSLLDDIYPDSSSKDVSYLAKTLKHLIDAGTSLVLAGSETVLEPFMEGHLDDTIFTTRFHGTVLLPEEIAALVKERISGVPGTDEIRNEDISDYVQECRESLFYSPEAIVEFAYGRVVSLAATGQPVKLPFGSDTYTQRKDVLDGALAKLDRVIGLDKVKSQMQEFAAYAEYVSQLDHRPQSYSGHMVFLGNPGTGKTTVARVIADILYGTGLCSRRKFMETTSADFIGEYVGKTAQKTRKLLSSAKGGVLFIDEAYSFYQERWGGDGGTYGKEALAEIVKFMEDNRDDTAIIMAGYSNEMNLMMSVNPGMQSRIGTTVNFPDYTAGELMEIAEQKLGDAKMTMTERASGLLSRKLSEKAGKPGSGNGRLVDNLIGKIIRQHALAMHDAPYDWKQDVIDEQDVLAAIGTTVGGAEDALRDLDALIGMEGVKKSVHAFSDRVRYNREMLMKGHDVPQLAMNMMFTGNPGTGKTTVAEILGRVLRGLGAVPSGHVVNRTGASLMGSFIGETARNVEEAFSEAKGGILFIDEAYGLTSSEGLAAMMTLLEDCAGETAVIFAGYADEMSEFMSINSGLESRISVQLEFADYSEDELFAIFVKKMRKSGIMLTDGAKERARNLIRKAKRHPNFGNARFAAALADRAMSEHAMRMGAATMGDAVSEMALLTYTEEDFPDSLVQEDLRTEKRNPIGF